MSQQLDQLSISGVNKN